MKAPLIAAPAAQPTIPPPLAHAHSTAQAERQRLEERHEAQLRQQHTAHVAQAEAREGELIELRIKVERLEERSVKVGLIHGGGRGAGCWLTLVSSAHPAPLTNHPSAAAELLGCAGRVGLAGEGLHGRSQHRAQCAAATLTPTPRPDTHTSHACAD